MPKTKKTKIAFCMRDMQLAGAEWVMLRIIQLLLDSKKYDITVFSYVKISEPVFTEWFANHPDVKLHAFYPWRIFGTKLPRFFLFRVPMSLMRRLYRWARRHTINWNLFRDIDILVDFYDFDFANEVKKFHCKKIAWWHMAQEEFFAKHGEKYIPLYDKTVFLTDEMANMVRSLVPNFSDRILRIYNPLDFSDVRTRAKNTQNDMENKKYFVSVARLAPAKDPFTLIRAFDVFWHENNRPDVYLVLIGKGVWEQKLKSQVAQMKCADKIIFWGATNNPFAIMRGAIANVLSSNGEGLPTVLIEAAALNVLNISSKCHNGPDEILLSGRAGLLFDSGNVNQLAKCMSIAYHGGNKIDSMKSEMAKSIARFDVKTISPMLMKLFSLN